MQDLGFGRKAKIVATVGPATSDKAMLKALFDAGVNVFRLNFSHSTHEEHRERLATIRQIEWESKTPIAILADLQGPKLRVGNVAGGQVELQTGGSYRLDLDPAEGDSTRAPLLHPEVFAALAEGSNLLLDDGRLKLQVERCGADFAETRVLVGGPLSNHKGVNLPDTLLPISPITEKDKKDLEFALDLGVDWVGLSFVQRPEDVIQARALIDGQAAVLIKIEKPAALECLEELVDLADAVMVARGDLGVEMPPEKVPGRQKQIIRACRLAGKPVVVATQMLESMINAPAPTRAEASDVATAVYDGADAVMLSAETAVGEFPVETVAMMDRIVTSTESDPSYPRLLHALHQEPKATAADAISVGAAQVAATIGAAAIVCYTMSGSTALRAARERPNALIIVLTNERKVAQRLTLLWGAHCIYTQDVRDTDEMTRKATSIAARHGYAAVGDAIVVTAGVPFGTPGTTNLLHIASIDETCL